MNIQALTDYVNSCNIPADKKTYIMSYVTGYMEYRNKLNTTERIAKDNHCVDVVLGAIEAYKNEIDKNKLSTILRDTLAKSADDIGQIAENAKSALDFFTNPYTMVLIVFAVVAFVLWWYIIRKG